MFQVLRAESLDDLAARLVKVLHEPLVDPMTAEWIAVVSSGTERWLRLELARHLGASTTSRSDGVAANLEMFFPRRLEREVLTPLIDDDTDPWKIETVAWAVLALLEGGDDPRLGPLRNLAPGATRWGRARRLADLFDRYLSHRPEMIRSWAAGVDVDEAGNRLSEGTAWQPHLWRLIRERIGAPSPAELRPGRLEALRSGDCPAEVPERVCLFGLATIPGGVSFLELLDALGTQRDVYLFLHEASAAMSNRIRSADTSHRKPQPGRSGDPADDVGGHPLLRSWARPARESLLLLADRLGEPSIGSPRKAPETLLAKIQADIHADREPAGDFVPPAHDRSIVIHNCHGATRQVEVLRDQILHLLAGDPTLTEDDVVVLCPALEEFAPLVETVFGPSAASGDGPGGRPGPPALAYRITDRSLRSSLPLFSAIGALFELLGSRFSDAAVLDFVNLAPVRQRYGFTDSSLSILAGWVETANTRWGIDGAHRSAWGIPSEYHGGSWRSVVDRLMLGVAVSEDSTVLAVGEVSPIAVEGEGAVVAGRFADLVWRLAELVEQAKTPHTVEEWVSFLQRAAADLFALDADMLWQAKRLAEVLKQIALDASVAGEACRIAVSLAEWRHILSRYLQGAGGRSDFFRGGVTFCSLTPLRGLPFRVICLLGMDETSFAPSLPDGDDLIARRHCLGDRDQRSDTRQAVLESLLAAREHLVITRSGRSVVTNRPVPACVLVAELTDAVSATLRSEARSDAMGRVEIVHPRQSFDERNFAVGASPSMSPAVVRDLESTGVPWSFDPLARAGAASRALHERHAPFLVAPLVRDVPSLIELTDLRAFLVHPVRYFLRQVLGVSLPVRPNREKSARSRARASNTTTRSLEGRDLLLELDPLEAWDVRNRLLEHRRAGGDLETFARWSQAASLLPPGRLADRAIDRAAARVEPLCNALQSLGVTGRPTYQTIDLTLPDGTRIVGSVPDAMGDRPGPVVVSVSNAADKDKLAPWLDLLLLSAHDPAIEWRAVLINASNGRARYQRRNLEIYGAGPEQRLVSAVEALMVVSDLFRRGQKEPLPLFPRLSPALIAGNPEEAWHPYHRKGDGDDESIQIAFDRPNLDGILSLAIRPDDPPGPAADRTRRYAHVLWGTLQRATAPPDWEAP